MRLGNIMKAFVYIIAVLGLGFFSCKKQSTSSELICGCVPLPFPHSILFDIIDKNGNNIIHSANDTLLITYVQNGLNMSIRLDIFKAQVSATDATPVSKYNGFVVSDAYAAEQGFMTDASIGNPGVRNFNLYLNGISIGTIYYDDLTAVFTLNGTPATIGNTSGFLVAGSPGVSQSILTSYNSSFPNGDGMYVLQYNGVIGI